MSPKMSEANAETCHFVLQVIAEEYCKVATELKGMADQSQPVKIKLKAMGGPLKQLVETGMIERRERKQKTKQKRREAGSSESEGSASDESWSDAPVRRDRDQKPIRKPATTSKGEQIL